MSHKSPRKLRLDFESAYRRLELLTAVLDINATEDQWGLGKECGETANRIRQILHDNQVPQEYKVAVIGRFKAGKSSFVNELLGSKLASEDTSPETAAVTTFKYGNHVQAKIKLVDRDTWDRLKSLYSQDPTDLEAHRFDRWSKFGKERNLPFNGQTETFDLAALERDHVRDGGHTLTLTLRNSHEIKEQRKNENDFRRNIREYTSGSRPNHCLVESIEIETPSSILGEGVTLVDTPGLDDTERFRVHLTERAVENVDAVLFLTKSGAAYGQSEKDFLLSLLRKGTVKQLIFVVTQVDQTYDQHFRQARDQDEDPETIGERIEAERRRIRAEIESTLDELDADSRSVSVQRYREQLGAIEIAFTSAANHRDWVKEDSVRFPITPSDPGGINQIKETLFRILSTESRLATARMSIRAGTSMILNKMLSVVENRRSAVRGLKNREVAETKLETFRDEFRKNGEKFENMIQKDYEVLKLYLKNRATIERMAAENIVLQADGVLASYETDDAGRHWRTRRSGNWGYMHDLQARVANKIFPKVVEQLSAQTEKFNDFIENFRVHLRALSEGAETITKRLDIGDDFHLDMSGSLEKFLGESLLSLQEMIAAEEDSIVSLLEDFVDDEVEEKISEARTQVAGIWGRGTTVGQTTEVRDFYRAVRSILREALSGHVLDRFDEFSGHLVDEAEALPGRALGQVRVQIEQASADIRAAAEAAIAGQKEAFDRLANGLICEVSDANREVIALLDADVGTVVAATSTALVPMAHQPSEKIPAEIAAISALIPSSFDEIRARATNCINRFTLKNGESGWSFTRIFAKDYISGATEIWLVDPYLGAPHQRRNLKEFANVVLSVSKIKTLNIVTRSQESVRNDRDPEFFSRFDKLSYEQTGMRVNVGYDPEAHDRFVVFNSGIMFKLGRGLDIYKPATGLASTTPEVRRVRNCEIDVFGPQSD